MDIIQRPSLRSDGRHTVDRVTIHAMAEFLDFDPHDIPAYDFLQERGLSAHYLVTPSGCAQQCLADGQIGRHAGKGLNKGNIGIEILVPGLHTYATFTKAIMQRDWVGQEAWNATVELVRRLRGLYGLRDRLTQKETTDGREVSTDEWLVRHSDICRGRKVDPGGGFGWEQFKKEVYT